MELLGDVVDVVAVADVLVDEAVDMAVGVVVFVGVGAALVGWGRDEEESSGSERVAEIAEDFLVGLDMLLHKDA